MVIWVCFNGLRVFYVLDDVRDVRDVFLGDCDDDGDDDLHAFHLRLKSKILTRLIIRPSLYLIMVVLFVDCFFYNILLINYTNLCMI